MSLSKYFSCLALATFVMTGFNSTPAFADRCSPQMLEKLPPKKREMIEKRCAEKASKPAYTISNKGRIDKEKRPQDKYTGDDLDKLKSMIQESWSKKYPKDEILGIHFHKADWKRTKNKRWNDAIGSFQYTDVSTLPAKVVVKTDNKVATIFPAFINKDNQDGSINTGVATKKNEYVINQMLISNY